MDRCDGIFVNKIIRSPNIAALPLNVTDKHRLDGFRAAQEHPHNIHEVRGFQFFDAHHCIVIRAPNLGAVKSGFHLGISFPLYKGTCIDRTHKGRGNNYDLRIRKQTGADSHAKEALSLLAWPLALT